MENASSAETETSTFAQALGWCLAALLRCLEDDPGASTLREAIRAIVAAQPEIGPPQLLQHLAQDAAFIRLFAVRRSSGTQQGLVRVLAKPTTASDCLQAWLVKEPNVDVARVVLPERFLIILKPKDVEVPRSFTTAVGSSGDGARFEFRLVGQVVHEGRTDCWHSDIWSIDPPSPDKEKVAYLIYRRSDTGPSSGAAPPPKAPQDQAQEQAEAPSSRKRTKKTARQVQQQLFQALREFIPDEDIVDDDLLNYCGFFVKNGITSLSSFVRAPETLLINNQRIIKIGHVPILRTAKTAIVARAQAERVDSLSHSADENLIKATLTKYRQSLPELLRDLHVGLIERELEIKLIVLAALCGENVLLLGKPGVAKTVLCNRAKLILAPDDPIFTRLLSRATLPDELFGPFSIKFLQEDIMIRLTKGYLPSARVAFLDEIFKANSTILNTLLTILNERMFDNGPSRYPIPLQMVVAASNEYPQGADLQALFDRFLFRAWVSPVTSYHGFRTLMGNPQPSEPKIDRAFCLTRQTSEKAREEAANMVIPEEVLILLYDLMNRLESQGIYVSTRRWTKIRDVIQIMAYLQLARRPSNRVSLADCAIVQHLAWSKHTQRSVVWSEYIGAVKTVLRLNSEWPQTLKLQMATSARQLTSMGKSVDLWLSKEEEAELLNFIDEAMKGPSMESIPLLSTPLPPRSMDHGRLVSTTPAEISRIKGLPGVLDMRPWAQSTSSAGPDLWWLEMSAPAAPSPYASLNKIEFVVQFARSGDLTSFRVRCLTPVFHPFFGKDGQVFGISTKRQPFSNLVPLLLQNLANLEPDKALLEALMVLPSTQEACNFFLTHTVEEIKTAIASQCYTQKGQSLA